MALADKVYDTTQRATAKVRINGALRSDWISLRGGDSYDAPVPSCDIELSDYSTITKGMSVTVDAGYDNDQIRLFTGGVYARGDEDPDSLRTQMYVRGATDAAGDTITSTASAINPPAVWPPIPSGQYIDDEIDNSLIWEQSNADEIATRELGRAFRIIRRPSGEPLSQIVHATGDLKGAFRSFKIAARDVSSLGLQAAIAGVLADSGISAYTLDFDDYTLGSDALLARMPGSEALQALCMLKGLRVQQLRSGVVLVRAIEDVPTESPAFTYKSSDVDLARVVENPNEIKVPFNPLLQIGQTIAIEDEATGIALSNWFLWGHRWEMGPDGDWSYMDLRGGDQYGLVIGVNPTANFSYNVDLEYIGDTLTAVLQLDASASFAADGTLTDADVAWTDNQSPHLISGTGFRKTITLDPTTLTGDLVITCTVTAPNTLTGSEDQTISFDAASATTIQAAIGVASDTTPMYTPDSGGSWADQTESTGTAVGLRPADNAHTGHGLYGFDDGHVELTRDGNASSTTLFTAAASVRCIAWDWRNTSVAWVLDEELNLYVCLDIDADTPSFGLYGGVGLRTTLDLAGAIPAIRNAIGLPAAGGVHIFGGTGTGFPLHAYDASITNHWVTQIVLGDLLTDGAGASDLRIADVTAPGDGMTTIVLTNAGGRANGSIPIYSTTDEGPSAIWTRATGLTAGLVDGRAMLPNAPLAATRRIAIFGDSGSERSVFKSTDGIAYTETTLVLPSGFECKHAMYVSDVLTGFPDFDGVYLLALTDATGTGGVYKSTDELSSEVLPIRDSTTTTAWPSGAVAEQISLGAPAGSPVIPGTGHVTAMTTSASPRTNTTLNASSGHWSSLVGAVTTSTNPRIFPLSATNWFSCDCNGGSPVYTKDAGATWAAISAFTGAAVWFARDAGGRIWALAPDRPAVQTYIYYSDDQGDTWTLAHSGAYVGPYLIACHPTDENKIVAVDGESSISIHSMLITTDRGANWTTKTESYEPYQSQTGVREFFGIAWLPSGRIVTSGIYGAGAPLGLLGIDVVYTDDEGDSAWTTAYTGAFGATQGTWRGLGVSAAGTKLVIMTQDTASSPNVGKPLVSTDGGGSWAIVSPAQTLEDFTGDSTIVVAGAAYDGDNDALYVSTGNAAYAVVKLSPVDATGTWENVTNDIADVSFGKQNLAAVPAS